MYKVFFGLKDNPFNMSPDPAFLYRSRQHEEAIANLTYGVQSRKGFIAITGEVGTGKTTMLECLRDFLDAQQIPFAFIFNSQLNPQQFFEMIADEFELKCDPRSKISVLHALNAMLIEKANNGQTAVLIVDEAHNLDWNVLEEIRLLGNLENRRGKLIQVIISGQPELDRKLDAPELRQLKQRIALRCALKPFSAGEAANYINSRMSHAGVPGQRVLSPELMLEIHKRTLGIPRLINLVCENVLLTAFALDSKVATLEILDEVSGDLRLEWPKETLEPVAQ